MNNSNLQSQRTLYNLLFYLVTIKLLPLSQLLIDIII